MKAIEIKTLRDKCILFNEFMIKNGGIPNELINAYTESIKLINEAYENGQIKILRIASKDIDNQIIRHMPLSMVLAFKSYVKGKIDIDLTALHKARLLQIERILKRGKINNVFEYELLLDRIDEICSNIENSDEIGQFNKLLVAYEAMK